MSKRTIVLSIIITILMWLKPISTSTNVEIQSIEDLKHQEILETTEGIIRISNAKIPIYQRKQ